ncbi:PhzF family phenazine biosynthesis isomerase (plasmid) [Embleya sp. NBC_00888]|uniref:PhzF family phenazine biosynthesis protein n=1 Tax=Embleya sp. NBC_00888 TaxID=2975960 RepID=UPI002F915E10|nr:PhzF family phenazine biosynthesis isomerase [Embleya sp. NBC_00888]
MSGRGLPVAIVRACLREGDGGSPTAVLDEAPLTDDERRRVPGVAGTSHAVFVDVHDDHPGEPVVSLRFFTSAGELPACGHGTVAALAFLAERARGEVYRATLRTTGRVFTGRAIWERGALHADFESGPVDLREPTASEREFVLPALGVTADTLAPGMRVASVGRSRMLIPVDSRSVLAALAPDFERLRAACDRLGLLGCYVHSLPTPEGRVAARMFAPSIGVPEDVANANSTACLAAHLADRGITTVAVDMGDALGSPATITAIARQGPTGPLIHVGGQAAVTHSVRLP